MKKKIFNLGFVQEWGTYPNQTLVCVGLTVDELIAAAKKYKSNKNFMDWILKQKEMLADKMIGSKGFFAYSPHCQSILWIKEWEDNWENMETLIHETFHAVYDMLGVNKGMTTESEALAYQQEYLFKQIRRFINKHYYKDRKKRK